MKIEINEEDAILILPKYCGRVVIRDCTKKGVMLKCEKCGETQGRFPSSCDAMIAWYTKWTEWGNLRK